ncbi:MAG: cobalamin biosynthesis protein [Deferribacterota bacterium]|nr:cobalamin biosynthesis protein [Deferribacterota bacterium]
MISILLNHLLNNLYILLIAIVLDLIIGEPPSKIHPVVIIGKIIKYYENRFYKLNNKKIGGLLLSISTIFTVIILLLIILNILKLIHVYLNNLFCVYIVFSSISIKSLSLHAMKIYNSLKINDIKQGKKNLSHIVSRDVDMMDRDKIITSTVESVSENFVDAVLSPIIYGVFFGVFGAILYKTINTMDSMVGYKNERYKDFGFFAAKIDDYINYIPARISIIFILLGSMVVNKRQFEIIKSFYIFRKNHESLNAAHPMSAFAGALDIKLGGSTYYFGNIKYKPYIGSGKDNNLNESLILDAIKLLRYSSYSLIFILLICFLYLGLFYG